MNAASFFLQIATELLNDRSSLLILFLDENPYVELLKDPVFMLIAISNLFGMAGLYVPFVYLVDCATADVSIDVIVPVIFIN